MKVKVEFLKEYDGMPIGKKIIMDKSEVDMILSEEPFMLKIIDEEKEERKKIAKKFRDKHVLETHDPMTFLHETKEKAVLMGGVSPENYDIIKKEKEEELKVKEKEELKKSYELCKEILKYYCDIPEEYYEILPLWIIGTYIHEEFGTYPLLFINAIKGSGKSRLLKLVIALSKNGKIVSDLKESVLFRTAKGCTIGIDEFESVGAKEQGTLRTLLNAAYKKGNAVERMKKVMKREGEEFVVERFDLYTPIAMANIWGLEEVLQDRCLTIILDKSNNSIITKLMENFDKNPKILELKRTLCSLCSVVTEKLYRDDGWNDFIRQKYDTTTLTTLHTYNTQTTQTTQQEIFNKIDSAQLNGRNLELFFPLFLIAQTIDNSIFESILKIAKKITEDKQNEEFAESKDISLIDYVSKQDFYRGEFKPVNDILKEFKLFTSLDEEEIKWMNTKWIGRALKRTKLINQKRRTAKGIEIILDIDKAKKDILYFKTANQDVSNEESATCGTGGAL